jgi:hypothetical protein
MLRYSELPFEIVLIIAKNAPNVWYILTQVDRRIAQYSRYNLIEIQDIFTTNTDGEYRLPNGMLHRNGDLPAVVSMEEEHWYQYSMRHRDGDLPAIVNHELKTYEWYKYGKRHRDGDKPAIIILQKSSETWYYNGMIHRDGDLPAVIYVNYYTGWYKYGKKHRKDKPAVIFNNGKQEYWVHGKKIE